MKFARLDGDRGTGLVEYALLVALVGIGGLVAVSTVGEAISGNFEQTSTALANDTAIEELTPDEAWEQAQEDYDEAIADAKAKKAAQVAEAKNTYDTARAENKSLPKDERKVANAAAKADYNAAKSQANATYKSSVQAAKDAKSAAKAEYKASK